MLQLESLSRRYESTVALDDLSFDVGKGDVVGFLGPNGAGKTTAMRAIFGIVQLDSGRVTWEGQPVDLNTRRRFGYMPEERGLYPSSKVLDQLVFLARLHGWSQKDAERSAMELLDMFGLGDRANDELDALSLGNQQRVQLAASLVHNPELLVLDEPFSGLDPTGIESMSEILSERARQGVAVVFSSHQLDLVENICERVVIINKGRLVTSGATKELTTSASTLEVDVQGAENADWAQGIPGATVESQEHGKVRVSLESASTSDAVLDAARRAGSVTHFSFVKRRLSEVFREAVTQ